METRDKSKTTSPYGAWLAGSSVVAGLTAFLGASCCVLPILLISLGLSSALLASIAFLASVKFYLMAAAAVLIVAGLVAEFRKGSNPRRWMLGQLAFAALITATAYFAPYYEGQILRWFNL